MLALGSALLLGACTKAGLPAGMEPSAAGEVALTVRLGAPSTKGQL